MVERSNAMSRLYRSTRDKVMTGLAGGLSETLGIDSTLFRILLLVSIPFTGGAVIPVYFIAAMVIPKEPTHYNPFGPGLGHRVPIRRTLLRQTGTWTRTTSYWRIWTLWTPAKLQS